MEISLVYTEQVGNISTNYDTSESEINFTVYRVNDVFDLYTNNSLLVTPLTLSSPTLGRKVTVSLAGPCAFPRFLDLHF